MKICLSIPSCWHSLMNRPTLPDPVPVKSDTTICTSSHDYGYHLSIIVIYIVLCSKVSGSKGCSNNLCGNHKSSDQQPGKPGLATFLCLCISITALNISISISVTNLNISISITTWTSASASRPLTPASASDGAPASTYSWWWKVCLLEEQGGSHPGNVQHQQKHLLVVSLFINVSDCFFFVVVCYVLVFL